MGGNHSFIPHALVALRPAPWAHGGNDTVGRSESCNLAGRRARPRGAPRAEGGMESCPMTGPGNSDLRASSPIATPPPTQLIQHLSPCLFRYPVPPAPLQPPVAEQELPESGCCILGRPGTPPVRCFRNCASRGGFEPAGGGASLRAWKDGGSSPRGDWRWSRCQEPAPRGVWGLAPPDRGALQ